ncbi:hypothetical protein [Aeromicrobium sp. Leaf350]|uniref:hypothetical protein n=1 Tax=Aeromicrobium sp. Leaf350 TaxID=2876565 RepID=UPI001E283AFE|nr:hypothetical protein [Aeromicrobium sp. Leaf350]
MSASPARSTVRSSARTAAAPTRDLSRAGAARERALRIVAPARARARRAPFVVVVVTMLSAGLVGLVVMSTALQDQAFELARLQSEAQSLEVQQQQLEYEADRLSNPASLAAAATALGMVPNATPVFLKPDTGEIIGVPTPAGTQP